MMNKMCGVQYLRAYAALIVLIFHSALLTKMPFAMGGGGVDVFFVVSGFLMWAITSDRTKPGAFIAARVKRIVPVYWFATAAVVAAELAGLTKILEFDAGHLLASLLFVPSVAPWSAEIYPVLLVGWTLNYEMFFYAVFAALMVLPRAHQPFALSAVFVALVAAGVLIPTAGTLARFYSDPIILEFVAGVWLGVAWERGAIPDRGGGLMIATGAMGVILAAGFASMIDRSLAFGVPAIVLVLGVLVMEKAGSVAKLRVPLVLGDASYSIYIWHLMFATAAAGALSGAMPVLSFLTCLVVGVGGGLAGYWLIEEPIVQAFKRRWSALRPRIAG